MASAARNPTASLQTALGEFQSILSAVDREKLNQIKDKPAADAAIQLTASLDRENADKRKGPSISSRLYSLLLAVQQFSGVVDTFVSSSPAIAALVWGSVKFTMKIVINFLTYYEDVSKSFIDFDKWSPRFSEYQLLFPSSIRLQVAICEFHASIIRCCKQVILMLQRSWTSQLVNSLSKSFHSELEDQIRLIKDRAREVSFEAELAKAQSDYQEQKYQAQERISASSHRLTLTSFISKSNTEITEAQLWRETLDRQRRAETCQRLLDEISTFDHISAFNQARSKRYHSTGSWIFQTDEWSNWKKADKSQILWLSGKIGAGKTVLSATIVDHLLVSRKASESISFFFPRFDHAESLLAETIIRSLIRQNLQPDLVAKLSDLIVKARSSFYSHSSVIKLLESKLAFFSANYILIDALDECEPKERQRLLHILRSVVDTSPSTVKIVISGRVSLESEMSATLPHVKKIRMDAPEAASDIETFARQSLSERMDKGQLAIGNIVSLERICDALTTRAQGMFLWVALEIDDICSQVCEEDILVVLQNLPATLTEIFTRALIRISRQGNTRIANDIFKWVSVAKRPLLIDELQEALSIRLGESYSKPQRRPQRIENLSVWCANLVEIDDISNSVQFVHHTVLTFLLDTSNQNSKFPQLDEFHNLLEDLDTSAGELCITYLEWNDFRTSLEPRKALFEQSTVVPQPREIIKVALDNELQNATVAKISHLILRPKHQSIEHTGLVRIVGNHKQTRDGQGSHDNTHPFLEYASKHWLMHTRLLTSNSPIYRQWKRMLAGDHHLVQPPWQPREPDAQRSILKWAEVTFHHAIFHIYIQSGKITLSQLHEHSCNMVAESGSVTILQKCLSYIDDFAPSYWSTDMLLRMKIETMAAYLLSHEDMDLARQTQHWSLSKMYQPEMMFWNDNWEIKAIADIPGLLELAYFASVQWGLIKLMVQLLEMEPSLCHVPDCVDINPLEVAVMAENIVAMELLLLRGSDPNQACSGSAGSARDRTKGMQFRSHPLLNLAICQKNTEVMSLLIDWGANVNGTGTERSRNSSITSRSPGEYADSFNWELNILAKEYNSASATISYAGGKGLPVHLTAVDQYFDRFDWYKIYIRTDIEITWEPRPPFKPTKLDEILRVGVGGLPPLHYAIIHAAIENESRVADVTDLRPMEFLLERKADPNIRNALGLTALHLAVGLFGSEAELVYALLDAGADPALVIGRCTNLMDYAETLGFVGGEMIKTYRKY